MTGDPFFDPFAGADARHIQREKEKARKLRESAWWKRKRSDGICHYCRRRFKPADLTMDHVIPLARGGESTKENIVPCCRDCNAKKRYLMPAEFAHYLETLNERRSNGEEAPGATLPRNARPGDARPEDAS